MLAKRACFKICVVLQVLFSAATIDASVNTNWSVHATGKIWLLHRYTLKTFLQTGGSSSNGSLDSAIEAADKAACKNNKPWWGHSFLVRRVELATGINANGFNPDSRGWKVNWSVHAAHSLVGRLANPTWSKGNFFQRYLSVGGSTPSAFSLFLSSSLLPSTVFVFVRNCRVFLGLPPSLTSAGTQPRQRRLT